MINKNKYIKYSKISESKFRIFLRYFAEDLSATQIAHLLGISRNSINRYILKLRKLIYVRYSVESLSNCDNNAELDQNNSPLMGISVINDVIYVEFIQNSYYDDQHIKSQESVYDKVISFDNDFQQTFINSSSDNLHLIRGFISFAKNRLLKFNGVNYKYLKLHLKESEFRFNHRNMDIYKLLLELVRSNPI